MNMTFDVTLLAVRRDHGYTQSRLARESGYDHSYISLLESGHRLPARRTVNRLADALGTADVDRDRLLRAGGYAAHSAPDPIIDALVDALNNPAIPIRKREALRALVAMQTRMALAWAAAGADREGFDTAAFDREVVAGLAAAR